MTQNVHIKLNAELPWQKKALFTSEFEFKLGEQLHLMLKLGHFRNKTTNT
jgi:hypothetical protein